MKDSYTEIMDGIRKECPGCADKLEEQHRLLRRLNEAHARLEDAIVMAENGAFHGSNLDRWVALVSLFTRGTPEWLQKLLQPRGDHS